jgi:probable F420-dependent oxidoreductase
MRLGFALPQVGSVAGPDAVVAVAEGAERLGYDSLWVLDRSLFPLNPQTPYPIGPLPDVYKRVLDPLEVLTFAASRTIRCALGTSILNLPWYSPLLLARRLTTLDVLSKGRLRVGLGVGWSKDEYDAAGTPYEERGKRADELLDALKAIWTTDPVEFHGRFYHVPKSFVGPKPVQKPHPPIYMAAYTPSALKRVAREADAWFPVGIPLGGVAQMYENVRKMARENGRDLGLLIRANVEFSETPLGADRTDFSGTLDQIAADVKEARRIGAEEVLLDVQFSPDVKTGGDMVRRMEHLWQVAKR